MTVAGVRWTVRDRRGNEIYLTHERWQHVIAPMNHPEMEAHEEDLIDTIRYGLRRQEPLNPQKYRYVRGFDDLTRRNTHITAIVLFRFRDNPSGEPIANNYIVTAYQTEIG